jgi:single-stranded-DNA-specific exonuclease
LPEDGHFLGVEHSVTGQSWRGRLNDDRTAQAISQKYDLPDILGRVLAARGVTVDAAEAFMAPTLRDLMPAAAGMCDLDQGAERVARAIVDGESVGIIGDYDVDGISSSAMLRQFFQAHGRTPVIHIPHRLDEGYGPNPETLDRFKAQGVRLVITVDCGVGAHEPMAHARSLGMDVVIVDHHQAGQLLPAAHSIINPNRQDDLSDQGQLCAAGVAFVLLASVETKLRGGSQAHDAVDLLQWLDLVALATVCDVVPLTGLNRALVRQGLKVMARRGNTGLAALADAAGLRHRPNVHALGFVLGPRINAAGRLGFSEQALELLSTSDRGRAGAIGQELEVLNKQRQDIELGVFDQAIRQGEEAIGASARVPALIVTGDDWHAGVLGLVAGRLKERFGRPAIAVGFDRDGVGQGSGRSISGVDLGSAIRDAVQLGHLIKGGGHAMAAGLTVERDQLGAFRAYLEDRLAEDTGQAVAGASLGVDGAMSAGGATVQLVELLERAGPYGMGNPTPRFVFPAHRIPFADLAGQEHVRCTLQGGDNARLGAIAFRVLGSPLGEALLEAGDAPLHVAGRLNINDWGGKRTAQLIIDDAAPVS